MPAKQRETRVSGDREQGGAGLLMADSSEGQESPSVRVGRVVTPEVVIPGDGHRSVSNDGGGTPGVVSVPMPFAGRGEVEDVPGYRSRLGETARLAETVTDFEMGEDGEPLLDAWYAEFGDPHEARLIQRTELAQRALEVVIGTDDRVQITSTTVVPWRWICSLRITAANGAQFIGTGWLVGPRTVMTAGHCVFMHAQGGWAQKIEVVPGRNSFLQPFGSAVATDFRSVTGWTANHDRDFDYGAILLPPDRRFGDTLGFFGYAALPDAELLNLTLNLSGYPGDKPSGTQWFHARRAESVTARTIIYNIDTAGGQSGSPVWRLKDGLRHAVGIHTNGALSGNSATRIIAGVANNIALWKAAAP